MRKIEFYLSSGAFVLALPENRVRFLHGDAGFTEITIPPCGKGTYMEIGSYWEKLPIFCPWCGEYHLGKTFDSFAARWVHRGKWWQFWKDGFYELKSLSRDAAEAEPESEIAVTPK